MKDMKNRFFAFGCSFTKYGWPTWADIIGDQYGDGYHNLGQFGAGNMYIFNSIMEYDQHYRFNKDDLIIVQWSGIMREDRYINNQWITRGMVANYYPDDYIGYYVDHRGFTIRDMAFIKAIKCFLDGTGCEYKFISMVPLFSADGDRSKETVEMEDIKETYKDILNLFPKSFAEMLTETIRPVNLEGKAIISDSHPLPSEHYKYVLEILPEYLPPHHTHLPEMYDITLANIADGHSNGWNYDWPEIKRKKQIVKRL
jgi:hypothetical protein